MGEAVQPVVTGGLQPVAAVAEQGEEPESGRWTDPGDRMDPSGERLDHEEQPQEREQPRRAPTPEGAEPNPARPADLVHEQRRDQEPRQDEEHVNAEEPSAQEREAVAPVDVEEQYEHDRHRTHAVQRGVAAEGARARAELSPLRAVLHRPSLAARATGHRRP